MRDHQQCRGNENIQHDVGRKIADWIFVSLKPGIYAIQIASQPIQFRNEILGFKQHRAHDAQVARTVLASNGFVLDGFSAKRTFHRCYRDFLRVLIVSISRRAL